MDSEIYLPMNYVERRKRVRKIVDDVCCKCTKRMESGLEDPCRSCLWAWMMNETMGYNEEPREK